MSQRRLYILLFIITNVTVFYITPIMYSFPSAKFPFYYFLLRGLLLLLSLLLLPFLFIDIIKQTKRTYKSGWISLLIVFLIVFYLSEFFFTFYPETNGKNDTYCSKTWMYYYWKLNNYGFRDVDFGITQPDKPVIVFAGDSYTEGHGIKDPSKRVSDVVKSRLNSFSVFNIGKNGMDINDELDLIQHLPIHPQILVLQICSNDWDYLLDNKNSSSVFNKVMLANSQNYFLSKHSVGVNYIASKWNNLFANLFSDRFSDSQLQLIYNQFEVDYRKAPKSNHALDIIEFALLHSKLPEDTLQNRYFNFFKPYNPSLSIMTDTVLFNNYLSKLLEIKNFCDKQKIELIVIPYPNMDNFSMKTGNKYTNRYLCNAITRLNIKCLDVYTDLKKANLTSYRVNNSDNHINEKASEILAETLIGFISKEILKQ